MSKALPVPPKFQVADGYCLPACIQMVLTYWGIERDQTDLARQLRMIPRAGTPASRVLLLASATLDVTYRNGTLADLTAALGQGIPPIVLVHTGQLPYWHIATAHALVLLEIDGERVFVNDPGTSQSPVSVSLDDLLLAWDEMANRYILLRSKK
jgi:ABC-type bacteriocin/lantibiotic exporter with double-glycine peptidase domain